MSKPSSLSSAPQIFSPYRLFGVKLNLLVSIPVFLGRIRCCNALIKPWCPSYKLLSCVSILINLLQYDDYWLGRPNQSCQSVFEFLSGIFTALCPSTWPTQRSEGSWWIVITVVLVLKLFPYAGTRPLSSRTPARHLFLGRCLLGCSFLYHILAVDRVFLNFRGHHCFNVSER